MAKGSLLSGLTWDALSRAGSRGAGDFKGLLSVLRRDNKRVPGFLVFECNPHVALLTWPASCARKGFALGEPTTQFRKRRPIDMKTAFQPVITQ